MNRGAKSGCHATPPPAPSTQATGTNEQIPDVAFLCLRMPTTQPPTHPTTPTNPEQHKVVHRKRTLPPNARRPSSSVTNAPGAADPNKRATPQQRP